MKIYRITPGKDLNQCCEKDPKNILVWFEESEPGDIVTVETIEMEEYEYDALPEYIGP